MKNHEYENHAERINRLNRVHSAGVYTRYRRARLRATSLTLTVVLIIACIVLYVVAR